MRQSKQCAVCGNTNQNDVIHVWERDTDKVNFYICHSCAQGMRVNHKSVKIKESRGMSTVKR